jgi:release factor glutamine methyltransferase
MTLLDLYGNARRQLKAAGIESPDLDARLLIEHFTQTTSVDYIANPRKEIDAASVAAVENALSRRVTGEPVHRILGYRDFYGMRLKLSPGTLEPRPDTETLVDAVLPHLAALASAGVRPRILDLGTGTGAIALALIKEVPSATALGVDMSEDALATARENAASEGLASRFETRRSDWFCAVDEKFHAIVANPPYIRSEAVQLLSREVRNHDPVEALDGGPDGLNPYRVIATQSANHLEANGVVAVEIGHDQFEDVENLFSQAGFTLVKTGVDLLGHNRALVFSVG